MAHKHIVLLAGLLAFVASACSACDYAIVQSIPDKLHFSNDIAFKPVVTHESLVDMINAAKKSVHIASFYMTLTPEEPQFVDHPTAVPGRMILEALESAGKRGVELRIVLNFADKDMNNKINIDRLTAVGAQISYINVKKLIGSGILHSKFIVVDDASLYLGSANFDWRSYAHVKEIGIQFKDCPVVAQDLDKIFLSYEYLAHQDKLPERLPEEYKTDINMMKPLSMQLGSFDANLYITGSPPAFNGPANQLNRTDDIDALLTTINKARKQVNISVMNYNARTFWPKRYWPLIEDALKRAAVERRVRVRLLFSDWDHTNDEALMWYRSLNAIQSKALNGGGIHLKLFKVPKFDDFEKSIPYARVKHDKYMVTDNSLFIGTSNWAPEYFTHTCGSSFVITPRDKQSSVAGSVIEDMQNLFERDFTSEFAHELN